MIDGELFVDNFAGGGGASTGISLEVLGMKIDSEKLRKRLNKQRDINIRELDDPFSFNKGIVQSLQIPFPEESMRDIIAKRNMQELVNGMRGIKNE